MNLQIGVAMNFFRTYFVLFLICMVSNPIPAKSQEIPEYLQDQIIEIKNLILIEGYEVTSISRTWLGRILIKASNGSIEREIVVNRGSGEIIHDRKKKKYSSKSLKIISANDKKDLDSVTLDKPKNNINKKKSRKPDKLKNTNKLDKPKNRATKKTRSKSGKLK